MSPRAHLNLATCTKENQDHRREYDYWQGASQLALSEVEWVRAVS
jgi:hypothetical protein